MFQNSSIRTKTTKCTTQSHAFKLPIKLSLFCEYMISRT